MAEDNLCFTYVSQDQGPSTYLIEQILVDGTWAEIVTMFDKESNLKYLSLLQDGKVIKHVPL